MCENKSQIRSKFHDQGKKYKHSNSVLVDYNQIARTVSKCENKTREKEAQTNSPSEINYSRSE